MASHSSTPDVASGRRRPPRRYQLQELLQQRLAQFSLRLRRSVYSKIDRSDDQFLRDMHRSEPRYHMRALVRLTGLAARSPNPLHHEALPQLVRELIHSQRDARALDVATAFDRETDAQAEFDKAQRRYDHAPTLDNHARAIAAGKDQLTWTQASLDSLYANQPTQ